MYSLALGSISGIRKRLFTTVLVSLATSIGLLPGAIAEAGNSIQPESFVVERNGATISIEPYGPNIVRVTLSVQKGAALASAGYGFVGTQSTSGWTHESALGGGDTFRSARLTVHVASQNAPAPKAMPLDDLNQSLRDIYFGGPHRNGPHNDTISIAMGNGKPLLTMWRWFMAPNHSVTTPAAGHAKMEDPGYRVSATFDSPASEHYYGLGQQQQGALDLRDRRINCWHDYSAIGGENVCVPFLVSSQGYGIIWDNSSKTTVDLGFNHQNVWSSEVGDRVSFFVIAGDTSDEIYQGYRQLTGVTHLLPKSAYGYIQSKAIYPTQEQILDIAKGYRERKLPLGVLVVDFLNMTKQGEMDLDPKRWPDPAAMNKQLHAMGVKSLLSVWPHFASGTRYYDMLRQKGWLIHKEDGTPDEGGFKRVLSDRISTPRIPTQPSGGGSRFETDM